MANLVERHIEVVVRVVAVVVHGDSKTSFIHGVSIEVQLNNDKNRLSNKLTTSNKINKTSALQGCCVEIKIIK